MHWTSGSIFSFNSGSTQIHRPFYWRNWRKYFLRQKSLKIISRRVSCVRSIRQTSHADENKFNWRFAQVVKDEVKRKKQSLTFNNCFEGSSKVIASPGASALDHIWAAFSAQSFSPFNFFASDSFTHNIFIYINTSPASAFNSIFGNALYYLAGAFRPVSLIQLKLKPISL